MSSSFLLWYRDIRGELTKIIVKNPLWIDQKISILGSKTEETAVVVRPIAPRAGYVGVAIIPDELAGIVAICGKPLRAGMHPLRHGDRLDIDGQDIWIATDHVFETVPFDPSIHGERQFCSLTKLPLSPDQDIVVCPGTPGHSCGQIYAKSSWDRAMETQQGMRCASCGFRPGDADWRPPQNQESRRMDDILKAFTAA